MATIRYKDLTTYREPLCAKDEKGVPLFSPLCNPNHVFPPYREDTNTNGEAKGIDCTVSPVVPPSPQVKQYTDRDSAYGWFKDPTYAQRASARRKGVDDVVLETNPSLIMYHKLKLMEKTAASILQTV